MEINTKKTICLEEKFKMFKGSFELFIAVISQNIFKYFTLPCHTLTYFKYLKYISNGPPKKNWQNNYAVVI